jgi:hypothetical protein
MSAPDVRRMWLVGHGRMRWPEARAVLDGLSCAWADLEGWHQGLECPVERPLATHLWGWSSDRWARVYLDGDTAVVGVLSAVEPPEGEPVEVELLDGRPWGEDEQRLPRDARRWGATRPVLLEVRGLTRCTFIHLGEPIGAESGSA